MKGDNAKSHNYTTYRLSGVFGMPIFVSPLFDKEVSDEGEYDNKIQLKTQKEAYMAATSAELTCIAIDKIDEEVKKLINKE